MKTINDIIKYLEKKSKNAYNDITGEFAQERVENLYEGESKDFLMEKWEEEVEEIRWVDPQDYENYFWEEWYASGYEVAIRDLLYLLNK